MRGQALPCMEGHSIEQEDFLKKKKTIGGTLGNSPAATAPVFSPPGCQPVQHSLGAVAGIEPKSEVGLERVHNWGVPETTGTNRGVCTPRLRGN